LRTRRGAGAEIVSVQRGSAADRAGLRPGDVITMAGAVTTPSPAQVTRLYASMSEGQLEIVAVTRADRHFVTTLTK
jgi:S1-C subfamily serine protease